jgi:hypothetical protein
MKRLALGVVLITIISCILPSCNSSKTLQELLQEESKAIDRFIATNDFVPLKNYPSNGVFKEKEYFRTNDGLFFHVVDSGNGKRAQANSDVSVRFDYMQYVKSAASGDTTKYYGTALYPYSFIYGIPATYTNSSNPLCQAWVIPLSYVGEGAVIDMIIPSSIGASSDNRNVTPVFYKNLRYTKID